MIIFEKFHSTNAAKRRIHPNFQTLRGAICIAVLAAAIGAGSLPQPAGAEDPYDSWYFTPEQVNAAYQYQENYGERLRSPLPAKECLMGKQDFVASYRRAEVALPCRFIHETSRHLKEMLAVGAAKYLFPLDADHAHLGIPTALWHEKYQHRRPEEIFPAILRETSLVALYHTAEHLKVDGDEKGLVDETTAWKEKRNVLGFFDGRAIQILSPHPQGHGVGMPEGYEAYGGFTFLASPRGELFIFNGQKMVTFDIALDHSGADDGNVSSYSDTAQKNVVRVIGATARKNR